MPEVHELRDALPNDQPHPITSVGVLAHRNTAPQGYDVILTTDDNADADLWKDRMFKSKTTRYLCFTRHTSKDNGHVENVVVDVKLVGDKETLPVGFVAVQDTMDTKEPVFQKKRLCVKLIPRDSTDMAVCDLRVTSKSRSAPTYCTLLGELNGMSLWIRWRKLPPIVRQTQTSTAMTHSSWEGTSLVQNPSLPYSQQPDASTQGQPIYSVSAMEGIPFVLHERFGGPRNNTSQYMILDIPHKTFTQIETEYDYDFLTERSVAAHQPPSQH